MYQYERASSEWVGELFVYVKVLSILTFFIIKRFLITLTFDLPQPGEHKFTAIKFKRTGIKLTPRMTYQLNTNLLVHTFTSGRLLRFVRKNKSIITVCMLLMGRP